MVQHKFHNIPTATAGITEKILCLLDESAAFKDYRNTIYRYNSKKVWVGKEHKCDELTQKHIIVDGAKTCTLLWCIASLPKSLVPYKPEHSHIVYTHIN